MRNAGLCCLRTAGRRYTVFVVLLKGESNGLAQWRNHLTAVFYVRSPYDGAPVLSRDRRVGTLGRRAVRARVGAFMTLAQDS